jgi:hypothetical protein
MEAWKTTPTQPVTAQAVNAGCGGDPVDARG